MLNFVIDHKSFHRFNINEPWLTETWIALKMFPLNCTRSVLKLVVLKNKYGVSEEGLSVRWDSDKFLYCRVVIIGWLGNCIIYNALQKYVNYYVYAFKSLVGCSYWLHNWGFEFFGFDWLKWDKHMQYNAVLVSIWQIVVKKFQNEVNTI